MPDGSSVRERLDGHECRCPSFVWSSGDWSGSRRCKIEIGAYRRLELAVVGAMGLGVVPGEVALDPAGYGDVANCTIEALPGLEDLERTKLAEVGE